MAQCAVLLNDGSNLLLNSGDNVLLNDDTCAADAGGVTISGTHARPLLALPRRRQAIPIEFTFLIRSDLLRDIRRQIRIKSSILKETRTIAKVKSSILIQFKEHFHMKANLLFKIRPLSYKIQENKQIINLKLTSRETIKTIKKLLLEHLKDSMDD